MSQFNNVSEFCVDSIIIALMMEAVQTSETLINSYQSTRRYNPDDSHLQSHRRENLKSYLSDGLFGLSRKTLLSAKSSIMCVILVDNTRKYHMKRVSGTNLRLTAPVTTVHGRIIYS
jgi:hypothetical protein